MPGTGRSSLPHQAGTVSFDQHRDAFNTWSEAKAQENALHARNAGNVRSQVGTPLLVIVDDEVVVAITLAEILRRQGSNVVWFTEPLCALEFIKTGPVDLLLSDINMPLMDGIELATRVHALQPHCCLLLISALGDSQAVCDHIASLKLRIHLECKPLRPDRLMAVLQGLLAEIPCRHPDHDSMSTNASTVLHA